MKTVKFWRVEIKQLSLPERIIFSTAIKKLLMWDVLKNECFELDLIRRILESEIQINASEVKADNDNISARV